MARPVLSAQSLLASHPRYIERKPGPQGSRAVRQSLLRSELHTLVPEGKVLSPAQQAPITTHPPRRCALGTAEGPCATMSLTLPSLKWKLVIC